MLRGRKKLLQEDFDDVPIEKVRFVYNLSASIIKEFLHEKCVIDLGKGDDYKTRTEILQAAYTEYCKERAIKDIDIRQLGEELSKLGIENSQRGPRTARKRYYIGIILKSELQKGQASIEDTITAQVMEAFLRYLNVNEVSSVRKSVFKTYLAQPPTNIDAGQAERHITQLVQAGRIFEDDDGALSKSGKE